MRLQLKVHEQDDNALAALLKHAAVQAVPSAGDTTKRLFRLRQVEDKNEVFEADTEEVVGGSCLTTVWDGPSDSGKYSRHSLDLQGDL